MQPHSYESDERSIELALLGDCTVTRDLTIFREPSYLALVEALRGADAVIANCEVLFHDFQGVPSWNHGGTHMGADPDVAGSLKWLGVSMVSTANNHFFDYGTEGVTSTIAALREHRIVHAGTGLNLTEASAPGFVETRKGRVALIAATATLPANGAYAADPRGVDRGRAGANVLRHDVTYVVPERELSSLRAISRGLGFEARKRKLSPGRNPGRIADTDTHFQFLNTDFDPYPSFRNANFVAGKEYRVITKPHQGDLERNLRWIANARYFADWVVMSVHCHNSGAEIHEPPEFFKSFARAAIEAGADAVVGHGPHHAYQGSRGIEIYRDKPILYGLGTFLDQMSIKWTPADGYERYGLLDDAAVTPATFNRVRAGTGRNGSSDFRMEKTYAGEQDQGRPGEDHSAFATVEWRDGRCVNIRIRPVTIDGQRPSHGTSGRPMLASGAIARDIVERFQELSKPFGTRVELEEAHGRVTGVVRLA